MSDIRTDSKQFRHQDAVVAERSTRCRTHLPCSPRSLDHPETRLLLAVRVLADRGHAGPLGVRGEATAFARPLPSLDRQSPIDQSHIGREP